MSAYAPKDCYGFRKGKLYRILARESMEKEDSEHYKAYYVDEVLQMNVKEQLPEYKHMFESRFEGQMEDICTQPQLS